MLLTIRFDSSKSGNQRPNGRMIVEPRVESSVCQFNSYSCRRSAACMVLLASVVNWLSLFIKSWLATYEATSSGDFEETSEFNVDNDRPVAPGIDHKAIMIP